ncbi:MAG: SpoIIE family protein phosphatase [Solirubrobacterales bacterium]|nr:SpoIIE family protein phosphatase [Solirubrobacterales bacterium]
MLLRDARAQRRQVDALRHTATLLATAEEVAGLGSWEWDLRTGRQRWSDELYRLLGLDPQRDEPTFDRFMSVVHPEDRPLVEAAGRRALAAQESSVNVFRIVHADGKVLVVEGAGRAIRDARGDVSVIVGTTQDITERKAAERALVHAAARHARQERTRDLLLVSDLALQEATLDHLFATMVARVCRALPCDGARLLASGGTHEAPTILAAQGPAQADWEARFPESIGQAAEVLGTGHALSDGGRDAGPASRARLAAAPLLQEDQVIGVLQVVRAEGGPFDDDDLGLLQLAADRLALAASHGRLVSRERHIAHTLQQSLLPRTLPEVPRLDLDAVFRPAGEGLVVGGDFYDAFPIGDDRWVLVVGDVCGKGAEAAALTALVRYTLRAEAMHEPRPGELLGLLNDAMLAQHLDHRFCTALCALIDVSSPEATLTIAAGGHPMPLIVRADGDVEPPLDPTGPIIGVLPGADFDEHMVRLKPGDALIAFTDGLIDAHAPRRIVTFHELARAASSTEPRSATDLVHRLLAVACGPDDRPVRDDIAVLAMRVRLREGDACGRPRGAASAASPASAVDTPVEMPAVEQEPERESGRLVARADGGQACATRACGVSRPAELARSTL